MRLLKSGFKPLYDVNFIQTNWGLTELCNYSCSYCVNKHKRQGGSNLHRDTMMRTLHFLKQTNKEHYFFTLEGGEVMLYPHLDEMLETIAGQFPDGKYTIRLITNGSAPAEKFRNIISKCAAVSVMFIITLHFEHVAIKDIAEKISTFGQSANKYFLVKILVAPGKLAQGLEAVSSLQKINFSNYRILHVLHFETGEIDSRYTQEELDAIHNLRKLHDKPEYFVFFNEYSLPGGGRETKTFTYTEGIQQGLLRYRSMLCAAGTCSIRIEADGSFSRTGFCGKMPYFLNEGNPFADPQFTAPMICPNAHCTCTSWTKLPKWRDAANAPKWLREAIG